MVGEAKLSEKPSTRSPASNDNVKVLLRGTIGLATVILIAGTLFWTPELMGLVYTMLAVPLIVARYFMYHQLKEHFFLLDFCYYVQLNLLLLLWYYGPYSSGVLFGVVYVLASGPLAAAVFMWKNALVLHDIDRFTSTFIHMVPPLVMYQLRWHPNEQGRFFFAASLADSSSSSSSLAESSLSASTSSPLADASAIESSFYDMTGTSVAACVVYGLVAYVFWQAMYILKTEILDRKRFKEDETLITSLRWLTVIKPHGIYLFLKSKGLDLPPLFIIVVVQLIYTVLALLPAAALFFHIRVLNEVWLVFLLCVAIWNGFNFERERRRRRREALKKTDAKTSPSVAPAPDKLMKISSSKSRFLGAVGFIILVLLGNKALIEQLVLPNAFHFSLY